MQLAGRMFSGAVDPGREGGVVTVEAVARDCPRLQLHGQDIHPPPLPPLGGAPPTPFNKEEEGSLHDAHALVPGDPGSRGANGAHGAGEHEAPEGLGFNIIINNKNNKLINNYKVQVHTTP